MTLPTLTIVADVMSATRAKFYFGSSNKRYAVPKDPARSKKLAAIRERTGARVSSHAQRLAVLPQYVDPSARDKVAKARQGAARGGMARGFTEAYDATPVGNCYDMASYAIGLFAQRGILPVERIDLIDGDHSFVGVGRFDAIDGQASQLQTFGRWGATAFVCDPWTNIACPASDYPQRWNLKMDKWKAAGKEIGYWEPSDKSYHWISPDDEKDSPVLRAKASSDRMISGDTLTLYLYANGLALETDRAGELRCTDMRHRGEPEAYTGNVFDAASTLFVCPHFAPTKVCKRLLWTLPSSAGPLPSLKVGNPYTVAAQYLRQTLYPSAGAVPGGLDGPLHTRPFEAWLDATIAASRGNLFSRLLKRLF